jgi:mono/diheme cytochrome c family protein
MRRYVSFAAVVSCSFLLTPRLASAQAANPDGKTIFSNNKCQSCHTITALGVERKKSADDEKTEKDPPDLSGVGIERNAAWITKYMLKKESIKDEKHMKKFKGSEADLAVLAQWLETLKTKPKK